ncbi:myelin-oligodendrocyte glycoprotein-like [Labrus bergylta]|uniref:myelin-oligodendrocyte glycoprotein-like n=1 Tax=Labrus bergylta TaxID=56723 RepID=UPI0033137264
MVVHVYENGQDQPYRQDKCYHGNTEMNSDPLRSKDLSVTIRNSGKSDSGKCICTVRREGYILAQKEPPVGTWRWIRWRRPSGCRG